MDPKNLTEYFRNLDRAYFIGNENKNWAYLDEALPIGYGQTISQPSLVLAMTLQLAPEKTDRILEIGTGSGYQTALLARFAREVYTIERIADLSAKARDRLTALGFANIDYRVGDGSAGWPENAPYDKIMVTAAAARIPAELEEQLGPGGRMIIPVGRPGLQDLLLISRGQDGRISRKSVEKVVFVELKGKYGWSG
ncbi:MAG TPA: protein-L-isoaspartate(D-aspartate) O-methyltransferase [Clostridiales bacterium]|nr:protein-L-isoaspartate(D-aspartate) O-methyltransferase [Clostridiales bacterium]